MSPEAYSGMARADRDLWIAAKVIDEFPDVAARDAHLAAFHAAQSFLFDRTGKVAKTHPGVRSEFSRIAKDLPSVPADILSFLGDAYRHKEVADYGANPMKDISHDQANDAMVKAKAFVDWIRSLD